MSVSVARRIVYITGSRADFGLMASTLDAIANDSRLSLSLIVTGMHLSHQYGYTVRDIEATDLPIGARVEVNLKESTGAVMASNIGHMLLGFVPALQELKPDSVLLLGDRGEMLAGALAAIHLGIPIVHVHGGERSGTVDEPVRHAISKLATMHLVATLDSRQRLLRMGEMSDSVHVVGAPGLDGLANLATISRESLCRSVGFDPQIPIALFLFHPVWHELAQFPHQVDDALNAALSCGLQVLALMPNSDAGSCVVSDYLIASQCHESFVLKTHLARHEFVSWMASVDVLIGNSSSGIIEAASFGTPVVNIGSRQHLRERNINVIDVPDPNDSVHDALISALRIGRFPLHNLYGDGQAGPRIVELLATTHWSSCRLAKCNAY